MTPLIIVGCGYLGSHLARVALAEGRTVRVCARSTGRLAPLGALGAQVKYLDVAVPKQLPVALSGLPGATVIYAVPPDSKLRPGQAVTAAMQAAYGGGAGCFILFSSSGLYGDRPDDESWIDESSDLANDDPPMANVKSDEEAVARCDIDRLRTITLRLAPVYGPGRGIRARMRKGDYRIIDDGEHAISRIYIDDLVQVIATVEDRGVSRSLYLVADDEPTTQGEYARWLSARLGLPMPASRPLYDAGGAQVAHRNRKIRNTKLKAELGITLRYPTFRDGEVAIEATEAAIEAPN